MTEVLSELERVDWAQVFIAERQLTMKGKFYNYATDTVDILDTPKKYFYQLSKQDKRGKLGSINKLSRLDTALQAEIEKVIENTEQLTNSQLAAI